MVNHIIKSADDPNENAVVPWTDAYILDKKQYCMN
jgi:hypothetical protein